MNAARQAFGSDPMQSAGKYDVIEIPAGQLRTGDLYVRSLDDKLGRDGLDVVHVLKNMKSGQFHVVIRYQKDQSVKVFR